MATALCASCKSRVEDGAVRCPNCNADLYMPGTFLQVVGCVVASISLIPFAVSEVTTGERDMTPLIIGCVILVAGVIMFFAGRARNKAASSPIIVEADVSHAPHQP